MGNLGLNDWLTLAQTAGIVASLILTLYFARRQSQTMTLDVESRVLNDLDEKRYRISELLIEQPGRYPSIETIASQLNMHPRALRRRLEAEGTSYRELLAEVRMRLAIEYLRKTQMTNEEIASRLGYSEAANFRHAFARWTRKSPSAFRSG